MRHGFGKRFALKAVWLVCFGLGGPALAAESSEAELRSLEARLHAVEAEVAERELAKLL